MSEIKPDSEVLIRARVLDWPNTAPEDVAVELFSKTDQYKAVVRRDLIAEVIAPPLPPEPPVGAYVLVGPEVYRHDFGGWQHVAFPDSPPLRWEQLPQPVTRLYREDEQPQEKYVPVKGESGWPVWQHSCGWIGNRTTEPHPDEPPCHICSKAGEWFRLYRRSSDGG